MLVIASYQLLRSYRGVEFPPWLRRMLGMASW